jgi:hypothetical protein
VNKIDSSNQKGAVETRRRRRILMLPSRITNKTRKKRMPEIG